MNWARFKKLLFSIDLNNLNMHKSQIEDFIWI